MADEPNGTGAPGDTNEPNTANIPAMTAEQFNRAFSARQKAAEKAMDAKLSAFAESLASRFSAPPEPVDDDPPDPIVPPGDHAAALKDAVAKVDSKWRKRQKTTEDQLAQIIAERDAERNKSREASLRAALGDELARAGIVGTQKVHALGYLMNTAKRVTLDDEGGAVFIDPDTKLPLTLREGVDQWSKTDDASIYLPPRGASGSGDGDRNGAGAPSQANPKMKAAADLAAMLS